MGVNELLESKDSVNFDPKILKLIISCNIHSIRPADKIKNKLF